MSQADHGSRLPSPERAFLGLDAYTEGDAAWFIGRSEEVAQIRALVQDYPLVLLTGHSGVGKTSLVRAALVPCWRAAGWHCIYLSLQQALGSRQPPLAPSSLRENSPARAEQGASPSIAHDLRRTLDQLVGEASPPGATFESAFERIAQRHTGSQVVIVLDQFEDLMGADVAVANDLFRALEELVARRWPHLRALIVYRGDADPDLGAAFQTMVGLVGGAPRCYLLPLPYEAAAQVLRTGLDAARVSLVDEDLPVTILNEIQMPSPARRTTFLVFPAHLQMVGQTVCQAGQENAGLLTDKVYEGLGGAQDIVKKYLTRQLQQFDTRQTEAEKVLVGLVRHGRQSERELQEATGLKAELTEKDWSQLLLDMAAAKLVRVADDTAGIRHVEIIHELLAEMVERETVHQERELHRLRGTLALRAAALERGPVLLRSDTMAELYSWRERIVPSPNELQLLLYNGLMEQGPVWFWLRRVPLAGLRPFLVQARASPLVELRRAGGLALAAAGTIEDALKLQELLEDTDPGVRQAAARALVEIIPELGWDDALLLRYLIDVPDPAVRRAAAGALAGVLAEVGRDIVPDLPLLLSDEDPEVRYIADLTLSRVAGREDIPLLRQLVKSTDLNVLNAAWGALAGVLSETPRDELEDLQVLLTDEDLYVQGAAREALTHIIRTLDAEDEALLRDFSQSDDPNVRREATLALVRVLAGRGVAAIPDLQLMLDDWNAEIRHAAGLALADALAQLALGGDWDGAGRDPLAELREMMESADRPLRLAAAETLARALAKQGRDAVPELCRMLETNDVDVARAARHALEEVLTRVGREAIPDLQAMLQDPHWDVWQAAGLALARVLSELGRPGLRDLRGLLKDGEDPEVRRAGGQALAGVLRGLGRVSLPELRRMLHDEDVWVQRAAGRALAQVLEESGAQGMARRSLLRAQTSTSSADLSSRVTNVAELRGLLENTDPDIQEAARQALAGVTSQMGAEALPVLRELLADADAVVREAAQAALDRTARQMGRRAVPDLREMLHEAHPAVRHAAAAAITALDPVQGLQAWSELVVSYPLDNQTATRALVALDRELYCPFATGWQSRVL